MSEILSSFSYATAGSTHSKWEGFKTFQRLARVAIFALPLLLGGAKQYEEPLHYRIASAQLHGKGVDSDCCIYALALSSRLAERGIHGRLIWYRWKLGNSAGSHVLVVYEADGNRWLVDNEHAHPIPVSDGCDDLDLVYASASSHEGVTVELQQGLNHLSFF